MFKMKSILNKETVPLKIVLNTLCSHWFSFLIEKIQNLHFSISIPIKSFIRNSPNNPVSNTYAIILALYLIGTDTRVIAVSVRVSS